MQTQALLEQLPNLQFRVTGSGRFAVSAEGATEEEAVANFRQAAVHAVKQARLITVDIPIESSNGSHPTDMPAPGEHKILDSMGWAKDVPAETWDGFLEAIRQQREEDNARVTD